ncbi:hypothetical protein [Paludibacterium purpuratum]|uniref:LmbE family N-acetylglucosaminyl deacetylase n=1 Tax=Paludibacterium purpuratum TaxID=1144873 RepID=A0A4R7AZQ5_9NEIS|nr:hypothetical protein [Paludibacterium purpuratum]TDR73902.1 LmbE family N-acetylglucosaminyl deacetylase [Paludibacterium purpuratum]
MTTRRVLILSPHSDDTAFSLGGLLAKGSTLRGWQKHQLTLFVRSCHAPYAPELHGADAITAARCREDEVFCARHDIALRRLDFAETLLRGYPSIASIFVLREPEEDALFELACVAVAQAAAGFDLVLAPMGIGGHIEHVMVREACRRACPNALYYEDLPYAGDFSNQALDRFAASRLPNARCRCIDVASALDAKATGLLGYASQVVENDLAKVTAYSRSRRPAAMHAWRRQPDVGDAYPSAVEVLWGTDSALAMLDFPG